MFLLRRIVGMASSRTARNIAFIAVTMIILIAAPLYGGDAENRHRGARQDAKLDLRQAVSIALDRNLRLTDSRLATQEKEHQRREAFSDFFPSTNIQYSATWYRYQQAANIAAFAGTSPGRWTVRGFDRFFGQPLLSPDYPYRIDPYRFFTLTATMTQPIFTGGKLLNDYKFAKLGVDYSAIQYQVDTQDLVLDVYEAYYQLIQAEKLLEVAEQSIRALEALRNQTREFFKAGVVPKVDVSVYRGAARPSQNSENPIPDGSSKTKGPAQFSAALSARDSD